MNDESRAEGPEALARARQPIERQQAEIENFNRRLADKQFVRQSKINRNLGALPGEVLEAIGGRPMTEDQGSRNTCDFANRVEGNDAFRQARYAVGRERARRRRQADGRDTDDRG